MRKMQYLQPDVMKIENRKDIIIEMTLGAAEGQTYEITAMFLSRH